MGNLHLAGCRPCTLLCADGCGTEKGIALIPNEWMLIAVFSVAVTKRNEEKKKSNQYCFSSMLERRLCEPGTQLNGSIVEFLNPGVSKKSPPSVGNRKAPAEGAQPLSSCTSPTTEVHCRRNFLNSPSLSRQTAQRTGHVDSGATTRGTALPGTSHGEWVWQKIRVRRVTPSCWHVDRLWAFLLKISQCHATMLASIFHGQFLLFCSVATSWILRSSYCLEKALLTRRIGRAVEMDHLSSGK